MGLASSLTGEKVVVVTNWPELLKEPVTKPTLINGWNRTFKLSLHRSNSHILYILIFLSFAQDLYFTSA